MEARSILKEEGLVGFAEELAMWCERRESRTSSRVVGLSSRRKWSCHFLRGRWLQEQFVGWSGHCEWRFEHATLEVPVEIMWVVRCMSQEFRGRAGLGMGIWKSSLNWC